MLDTIFWLLNFPAANGYAMVFLAAFGATGVGMRALRGPSVTAAGRLRAVREREGLLPADAPTTTSSAAAHLQRVAFRVLFLVLLGGGLIGLLSLVGVPVTRAYIHANGVEAQGTVDGNWVRFTTADGTAYTLPNDVFTPSVHPDRHASVGAGGTVTVRYLPGHPQAYVIDSGSVAE
ncbi:MULTISPECIES: hypothetical protein [Microbacterium]|uniref:hypothetical protein n=1 Tax=Microbacterium TaxID=33882 RepID=UPI00217D5103|nr:MULTISPECIES: hypothetical protein [Microbacterium]UWF76688.1 hypothetical protein JSY13_07375 [Microbacterium neungamense]WCM54838.1 hypothetical protein JRG78_07375 [Microbacterium sp. EF45047]